MEWDRLALGATAAGCTIFGGLALVHPEIMAKVDVRSSSSTGRAEIRAMYGGMELGLGACFAYAAWHERPRPEFLLLQMGAMGGLAAGRLLALAIDRPRGVMRWLFLAEAATAAAGLIGYRQSRRAAEASPGKAS